MPRSYAGRLLEEFRKEKGYGGRSGRHDFAGRIGVSYEALRNREDGRTPFTRSFLKTLVDEGVLKDGDRWHTRFETVLEGGNEDSGEPQEEAANHVSKPRGPVTTDEAQTVPPEEVAPAENQSATKGAPYQRPRHRRRTVLIAVALIVLAGSCGIGALLMRSIEGRPTGALVKGSSTATSALATTVPSPVIVVVTATPPPATATPRLTATPRPPTNTPTASRTPTLTKTPTLEPTPFPLPFEDNFDDGPSPDWGQIRSKWRMVNYRLTPDDPKDALALVGDQGWSDYAVDVDVDLDVWRGDVYVITRYGDSSYMSFGVTINTTGQCRWTLCEKSGCTNLSSVDCFWQRNQHHIRLEVNGDNYTAFYDGNQVLALQDDTLSHGKAGLKTNAEGNISFDNFRVSALQ